MTQTAPDGEAVLKELAKAARRTGWWVQMGQESAFALAASPLTPLRQNETVDDKDQ